MHLTRWVVPARYNFRAAPYGVVGVNDTDRKQELGKEGGRYVASGEKESDAREVVRKSITSQHGDVDIFFGDIRPLNGETPRQSQHLPLMCV
ncbi:MAG: hypothetical protein ABIH92_00780 [Nanoarchaeota archaeon]